jgi:F5/8 type C domain/Alpha-L-fucosidase
MKLKLKDIKLLLISLFVAILHVFISLTLSVDDSGESGKAIAYQGRENMITEWFSRSKYGINIAFFPEAYPQLKMKDLSDGTWDKMVSNFDVSKFAKDVAATGAKYLIFSVGQTSGYYTSPSSVFMKVTNTKLGEYSPRRDLVKDVAIKLKSYNIPVIVYLAAEGPRSAPPKITNTFPAKNDRADADNRATLNAMVKEWSLRWKKNVAGWWLDGCYPWVTGLNNTPEGEKNVGILIDSTKVGNKNAISTCNPSIGIFKATTIKQDYMAGEEAYFHRYPRNRFILYNGKKIQWHVMSFLGEDWSGSGSSRYSKRYLAEYITGVNQHGGVVTIDMAVSPNGRIVKNQLKQMSEVKEMIRNYQRLPSNQNLALYKPVYMISNQPNQNELAINGNTYLHYATYAVDGIKNDKTAQAAGEYAWSLLIDLRKTSAVRRSIITFALKKFPTHYAIFTSVDGQKWNKLVDRKISKGGVYYDNFNVSKVRYVRVKSIKPDGQYQLGYQMAISEFELY